MSKQTFEIMDLAVFTLISVAAECVNIFVFAAFGNQVYSLSIAAVMGMIAIFRWNFPGLIVPIIAGLAGVVTRFYLGQTVSLGLWLAYSLGYLGLMTCLIWFRFKDKKAICEDKGILLGYYFSGYVAVEIARALCQIGNGDFMQIAGAYFAEDLLNVAFGLAVFLIACHQSNLVCDMNTYLKDIHTGPSSARAREEQKDYLTLESMAEKDDVSDVSLLDGGMLSEDDLKKMNETYARLTSKDTKFSKENKAIKEYQNGKKSDSNKTEEGI